MTSAAAAVELRAGLDFREAPYRREVFLRFYEFHLRYGAHPGAVYSLFPWLREHFGWSQEEALWFAFLNGNTQHPVTSLLLFEQGPGPQHAERIITWFQTHYPRLAFDTDRRHHKTHFPAAVRSYVDWLGGQPQARLIGRLASYGWRTLWEWATGSLYSFGRLSAWSYLEYVRLMGIPLEPDDLMLADRAGSRSHRNGLCRVLGREDLDWHASNPAFDGTYSPELLRWLDQEARLLLAEMHQRARWQPWAGDVSLLTLESALCTYKSWHRPNRRYPNVYHDLLYDRLRVAERHGWPSATLDAFWQARRDTLPAALRLEDNPHDPGCVPVKQNHYRTTGQVIMLDLDWPDVFANDFAAAVAAGTYGVRPR